MTAKRTRTAPAWTATVTPVPLWPTVAGARVDRPGPEETGDGWSLTVAGWVVGQSLPASEVQVLFEGALVCRTPVRVERGDVAPRFDGLPGADRAGFRVHLGLLGLPPTSQLEVVAVLDDGSPVHLATVVVNHRPLVTSYQPRLSPITVTSLGRMGTTWLMRLLAHHPRVVVHPQYPYELGMAKYWAHLLRVASGPADHLTSAHPETFTADAGHTGHNPYFGDFLSGSAEQNRWLGVRQPALLGACAQQSLDEFYGEVATATGTTTPRFFAEKSLPDHVPDVLGDLYPDRRELILVRDIRDVICSAIAFDAKRGNRSFGREVLDDDLGFVYQLQMDLGQLVRSWQRRADTALLVRYETLITAPEQTLDQILEHLGLAHTPPIVAVVLEAAAAPTPELEDHRTTANPVVSIGRWRTDLAQVHPDLPERCEELFGPLLTELGYPVTVPRARRLSRDVADVLGRLDAPADQPAVPPVPRSRTGGHVVVAASLAQRPDRGGHAWAVLSYLLGFRRLGWRVTLVDRLGLDSCVDRWGVRVAPERSLGCRYAGAVLGRFGLADSYCLLIDGRPEPLWRTRAELLTELRQADFLLNVMGFLSDPELRQAARHRAFLDIDPGFPQMWADLGLADVLAGHDTYLTVGVNIGGAGCPIPTGGRHWLATLPPIVLERWPAQTGPGRAITTVASWRGPFDPVEHHGTRYGLRAHEFRPLTTMAAGVPWPVEMALDIDPADRADRDRLVAGGWQLTDPAVAAGTPGRYRRYVQSSTAELTVAKGMYVQTSGGWFSDRSACYLASGRPVVAQDTGVGTHLPTGDGLLLFRTAAEAGAALTDVLDRYSHHAEAARALAEDHLDSDKVIAALVNAALAPA